MDNQLRKQSEIGALRRQPGAESHSESMDAVSNFITGLRRRAGNVLAGITLAAGAAVPAAAATGAVVIGCGPEFTVGESPEDSGEGGYDAGSEDGGGGEGGNDAKDAGPDVPDTDAGEVPAEDPVSPDLSHFVLTSPTPTTKVLGVEGDGVQKGLLTATIKDTKGNFVPGRKVSVAKTGGPAVPVISPVPCVAGDVPGVTNSMGDACFEVSATSFGDVEFTAAETTSEPDVKITQKENVTFCYGVTFDTADATMPRWDAKFFTPACADLDAVNLNTAGSPFETASKTYCLVPPFKFTANTANAPAKNSLTLIVTDPVRITNPVRVKDVGSISVSNSYHNNICADPTVGGTSKTVNPVSGDKKVPGTDKTMRLEGESPADTSGGAVWFAEVL